MKLHANTHRPNTIDELQVSNLCSWSTADNYKKTSFSYDEQIITEIVKFNFKITVIIVRFEIHQNE